MSYEFFPTEHQYRSYPGASADFFEGGIATGTATASGTLTAHGALLGESDGVSTGSGTLTHT